MFFLICILIGFMAAFVGSIVGLGGGVILVPILLILNEFLPSFDWASPQQIVGISVIVMIFTGLSSSYAYYKKDRIDFKSGLIFIIASVPGGIIGSWTNQFFDPDRFSIFLGILMLCMFLLFFFRRTSEPVLTEKRWQVNRTAKIHQKTYTYQFSIFAGFSVAFVVGMLSGMFGIGGGSLMVPIMVLVFRFPAHMATATSMFMILFTSISSSVTHIILGHVMWEYVWLFIPGAWFGGILGAKVNQQMKGSTVEFLLRALLLIISIRLIWQGIE
ncbi:sulfite exporter TauE/SafE family protein [Paraliobacillus sediminis]|uniref:sulfite exporter TauE/SafE family protein n=1 Tax=Paraliobacillus sediminis TaxID=1885916 RepID=UPI000E3CCD26|nr:sulfite exporter TauE/SafE family protein [Paraliobacillus sediminis]